MMIDLQELRTRMGLTQADMAAELGINAGTYAMIERGSRRPNEKLQATIRAMHEKYSPEAPELSLQKNDMSPDVTELLDAATFTPDKMREQAAVCMMEIFALQNKAKAARKQFSKALDFVIKADIRLRVLSEETDKEDMRVALEQKRYKAMKKMKEILAQNPLQMLIRIEMLKQEKLILENAIENNDSPWRNLGIMSLPEL